ncbi:MAG: septum formation protein Maf [Deltaproteobacteria bacterium]|jgi:septum formation protein|nr:septum formation protein Maf [Deltaproteobacteria bacterium]
MPNSVFKITRPLVIATASPARRKLISDLGVNYIADTVDIDESPLKDEKVADYVRRLASEKAHVAIPPSLDAVIVTVDTAIGIDEKIIGKPKDENHARNILQQLSGRCHDVLSAIAVRDMNRETVDIEVTHTTVEFIKLTEDFIDWYISTSEWRNRAGAYAIQGKGISLVKEIRGCLTNVIGISIPSLLRMIERL